MRRSNSLDEPLRYTSMNMSVVLFKNNDLNSILVISDKDCRSDMAAFLAFIDIPSLKKRLDEANPTLAHYSQNKSDHRLDSNC